MASNFVGSGLLPFLSSGIESYLSNNAKLAEVAQRQKEREEDRTFKEKESAEDRSIRKLSNDITLRKEGLLLGPDQSLSYDPEHEKRQIRIAQGKNKAEGLTAGRKAVDTDFAKDYNEWTSAGQAAVDKNLQRLQEAKNILEKRKNDSFGTSGRFTGNLPDILRSEESRKIRQDVQAAAQGALKATLGSQFTEKEGERIMKAAYDETLSPEANIEKINSALKELETAKQNKNTKSSFFEQRGTLTGFQSKTPDAEKNEYRSNGLLAPVSKAQGLIEPAVQSKKSLSPQDQEALSWASKNPNDPRAQKILQMHR